MKVIEQQPDIEQNKKCWPYHFDWPKISIVTPSYNQGAYIEETIRSVLFQNYPNLEYIIIDGGSTDNTVEIVKKYESRISYWVSEEDNGQSDAINKGLEKCTGKIFNWLNSDDYLEKDALFHIAKAFMENNADIVGGRERRFGENMQDFIHPGTTVLDTLESTALLGHNVQPCTFFLTEKVRETGLDNSLHYLMDMDMYVRYLLRYGKNKIVKIEPVISNFRLHGNSKTVSQSIDFESDRWSIRWGMVRSFLTDGKNEQLFLSFTNYYPLRQLPDYVLPADIDARRLLIEYVRKLMLVHEKMYRMDYAVKCFIYLWKNNGLPARNKLGKAILYFKYRILPPEILILYRKLKKL